MKREFFIYFFKMLEDYENPVIPLDRIKGRFILNINDHPDMREVFKGFDVNTASLV